MVKQKSSNGMKIALDAMGGDYAPVEVVKGAVAAASSSNIEVILVGLEDQIKDELKKYDLSGCSISVVHASEVVAMDERPVLAVKEKKDSSIVVGVNLVKNEEATAFVSAGNTGAVMTAASLILGRKRGIRRPALGAVFPFPTGPLLCLDLGANADCKPTSLVQFARMGNVYMERIFGVNAPRIGLLSSGEEDTKGSQMVQKACG